MSTPKGTYSSITILGNIFERKNKTIGFNKIIIDVLCDTLNYKQVVHSIERFEKNKMLDVKINLRRY